jgi:hypothetical protein
VLGQYIVVTGLDYATHVSPRYPVGIVVIEMNTVAAVVIASLYWPGGSC